MKYQAAQKRPSSLPATLMDVSTYLAHILDQHKVSAVSMAHAALKWVHNLLPMSSNPLDAALCTTLVEAEKRRRPGPIQKKEPASPELLASIVSSYAHEGASLKDLRFATMCVLSFVGLFRSAELLSIKACDITVHSNYIIIKIPESKTDIYRRGQEVIIHKSAKSTCPYTLLLRYLDCANINLSSVVHIFRNVVYLKSLNKYVLGNRNLSYTTYLDYFKQCLKKLGYDPKLYGLHSFRSGGATTIVKNLKECPSLERLLKIHGRWKSDTAKDMYIKEQLDQRINVSSSTGL
ncbi:MAG: hypothetical protein AAF984_10905 [Verrucomicrobiota bacterium]